MTALAEHNMVPILIAILIALVVAFWIFRGRSGGAAKGGERVERAAPTRRVSDDGPDGNSVPDEMAAATRDIAEQFLGVEAHTTFPRADGPPDNLQTMKGVGPKLAAQLNACGITRFDQLAGLDATAVSRLDERMGPFRGRIERDRLVEQADYLARGDTDGFEATFGRLGGSA